MRFSKKLLEIAKEYIKVCEKLNLRYFALGGTALGAMRHNGFIPWDDDLDFGIPKKDYETFIQEAPKYLAKQYFVQCHKTEKKWLMPYSYHKNKKKSLYNNYRNK